MCYNKQKANKEGDAMFNFILCDDEEEIRNVIKKVITKVMMPFDYEYKIFEFDTYDCRFQQLIKQEKGPKIYILDIEVKKHSGLTIASQIREYDWSAVIIILTAHYELIYEVFKNRLMLLDFISKFNDYEVKLKETLLLALTIFQQAETFNFSYKQITYNIPYNEILYILKDGKTRRLIIKTYSNSYFCTMTLNKVTEQLNNNFKRTHRACLVNTQNVKAFDYKNSIIIFKNNESINLFSRHYKKEIKMECG